MTTFLCTFILQVKQNWLDCQVYADYELLPADAIPLDAPSLYELFLFDYTARAYTRWSDGAEEFPEEDQMLVDNFGEPLPAVLKGWMTAADPSMTIKQSASLNRGTRTPRTWSRLSLSFGTSTNSWLRVRFVCRLSFSDGWFSK